MQIEIHVLQASKGKAVKAVAEKICEQQDLTGEALEECAKDLKEENEKELEEIVEAVEKAVAPNPILPATNEIIWGALSFGLLFIALLKFGLPAVRKAMADRTERIQSSLDEADSARAQAEQIKSEYDKQLADARNQAGSIIEEARQQADAMKREQASRVETELAEMRQRAQADIEASRRQAMADLSGQVAEIAIGAAETVVRQNLNDETNRRLVEDYISSVGRN